MIVVATADFEFYHDVVGELRDRGVAFTTVEPGAELPDGTSVVVVAETDDTDLPDGGSGDSDGGGGDADADADVDVVVAPTDEVRRAVEEAVALLRGDGGRTIVGVDPGTRPGIAVLAGDTVVAAFHVPLADAVATIREEVADSPDALVRVGDGARLQGATIVNELEDVTVELVDETGTTPYLGTGTRGMGDVLAAVNIARRRGEAVDSRDIEPTQGELQRIKDHSRRVSEDSRTIDEGLARRVAAGDLTVNEALAEHRERSGDEGEPADAESGADADTTEDADADG
ncbi:hypothetical protein NDI76_12810 [Halogeometricum sp. S1BR25-6]|uniref:Uncharacterized protein n=1 Tax=Halogeometricum salsisoli TaxID=2950536 RepID=A0ABU2GH80_9EURY|nr:hypothetical protein [Halogeometricum sp. S1BR25-6]MDS0299623.1 hypothetical protein [Halogeometricum sp. S1BR25-6]